MVQFCPWCKFYFSLFKTHYHTLLYITIPPKQRQIKFAPRTKLHHNRYKNWTWEKLAGIIVFNQVVIYVRQEVAANIRWYHRKV